MTKTILEALENTLGYQFDKDSLTYHRMMIHIKFLVKRLIYQEESPTENIGFLQVTLKKASLINGVDDQKYDRKEISLRRSGERSYLSGDSLGKNSISRA